MDITNNSVSNLTIIEGGIENVIGEKSGVSGWQTVLMVLSVLSYIFIAYTIIICVVSRVRLKPLWIIGILSQAGIAIKSLSNTHSFTFDINLFMYSSLTLFPSGDFVLMLLFPIVGIIFLASKRKLEHKADVYREKKESQRAPSLNE